MRYLFILIMFFFFFFFNDTATTEIYTLSLHDALPISGQLGQGNVAGDHDLLRRGRDAFQPEPGRDQPFVHRTARSEEHTSELQSRRDLVCRLLLEKKKKKTNTQHNKKEPTKRTTRVSV